MLQVVELVEVSVEMNSKKVRWFMTRELMQACIMPEFLLRTSAITRLRAIKKSLWSVSM